MPVFIAGVKWKDRKIYGQFTLRASAPCYDHRYPERLAAAMENRNEVIQKAEIFWRERRSFHTGRLHRAISDGSRQNVPELRPDPKSTPYGKSIVFRLYGGNWRRFCARRQKKNILAGMESHVCVFRRRGTAGRRLSVFAAQNAICSGPGGTGITGFGCWKAWARS